jgi:3-oxoacyl-[acyl-carrier protein] reductase
MKDQWVITGGAFGIGAQLVSEVVGDGAHPIVWDVNPPQAAENVGYVHVDLLQAADIEAATNATSGGARAFVHCAAMGVVTRRAHADFAQQQCLASALYDVASVAGVQGLYDHLIEGQGATSAVSSAAMDGVYPGTLAYGASKAALRRVIDQMAVELGPKGVRVNGVSQGAIDKPMTRQSWSDARFAAERRAFIPLGRQASWMAVSANGIINSAAYAFAESGRNPA